MVDNGSILVTGAAGQLGSVGRTVTGLLLDRGFSVRAMVLLKGTPRQEHCCKIWIVRKRRRFVIPSCDEGLKALKQ